MRELSDAEKNEIYETVLREMPQIDRAATKMLRSLKGLSDVGQKHAIEKFLATWIDASMPDMEHVVSFTAHLKQEIDLYIASARNKGGDAPN